MFYLTENGFLIIQFFAEKLAVDLYETVLKLIFPNLPTILYESHSIVYIGEIEAKNKGKLKMYYIEI